MCLLLLSILVPDKAMSVIIVTVRPGPREVLLNPTCVFVLRPMSMIVNYRDDGLAIKGRAYRCLGGDSLPAPEAVNSTQTEGAEMGYWVEYACASPCLVS